MARTRNIKPGFFKNDLLAEIEPLGRLLFAGLWTIADREGRLEDRPKRIKAEVLPYDNCDIDELLAILSDKEFIIRYEISEQKYIQITNFSRHQNPHVNESASEIPAPEQHSTSTVQAQYKSGLVPSTLNLKPSTLNLVPSTDISFDNETQPPLTQQPTKPKNEINAKHSYAEFVSLTNDEHSSLVAKYGEPGTQSMIEILDNYKGSHGKKYKSDYRAILNWVVKRYEEEKQKNEKEKKGEPKSWNVLRQLYNEYEEKEKVNCP